MTPKPNECASIHESAQIVRRSVEAAGCEEIDAVITPAEFAREIRDRHHLDHGDSNPGQLRQFPGRGLPGAFARKGADMHLVNDLARQPDACPFLVAPAEPRGIHHTGRAVWPLRLETRRGVRVECFRLVDAEAVERARVRRDGAGEVSATFRLERMERPLRLILRAAFQHDVQAFRFRRPDPKMRPAFAD